MTRLWHKRRSEFNHDWLKNRYMPALAKFLNLLDDKVEDEDFERAFVSSIFPEWEAHQEEVMCILRDFESEMSPKTLFCQPPLSKCDEQTKQWLGDLVHSLWLAKYPIKQWIEKAIMAANRVDMTYHHTVKTLESCTDTQSAQTLRRFYSMFDGYRRDCQELAIAIEKFPSEVKIT
jgi:hypothetical protein